MKEDDNSPLGKSDRTRDWEVKLYDRNNKMFHSFVIKDRTEHEAENEAFNQVNDSKVKDWTMMPAKKQGMTAKQVNKEVTDAELILKPIKAKK